jgi:hypothetical protein
LLTVVYIVGWCRSGSTVLGNVAAEVPGVFHAGELRFLWQNGVLGTGSNRRCGCGELLAECPLWSTVLKAACPPGRALDEHARDVVGWQRSCRTRHTRQVLRAPPGNGWPATLAASYHAIAARTGAAVIVDSSKFASDAALLGRLDGIRPVYLHLIRDPRAVAHSWLQPKDYTGRRGVLGSSLYWAGFNIAAERVCRAAAGAALRLRYEDLVANPRGTVGRVLDLAGLAGVANPVDPDGRVHLGPNHTVTGNPNRFDRGRIRLAEDRRWRDSMPRSQRALATAVTYPLLRRYHYARRP